MELKNKKILLTGADGFIGSHLAEILVRRGYKIRAFVYYNSFNSWGWLDTLPKDVLASVEVVSGDIRDAAMVKQAVNGCDVVFHLAALIAIPYSYQAPESYIDTNIKGTLNVLQACRESQTEKVLITSTSEVYGTARYVPINEEHPRQGQSPYSASKIGADSIAESFYRSFNLPLTIIRPFNTFGPRQSARAVIPTIISQLMDGSDQIRLGALTPTRDLLFVYDTVDAFVKIAESDSLIGTDVNIATAAEISVGDLAAKIISMMNPKARLVSDEARLRPEKSEVERLLGCNKKLLEHTGWKPSFTLEQGLKITIDWFSKKENIERYKTGIYNV